MLDEENVYPFLEDLKEYLGVHMESSGYEGSYSDSAQNSLWKKIIDFHLLVSLEPAKISKHKQAVIQLVKVFANTNFEVNNKKNMFKLLISTADQDIIEAFLKYLNEELLNDSSKTDADFSLPILSYCSPYVHYLINRCDQNIGKALRRFKLSEEENQYDLVPEEARLSLLNEMLSKSLEELEGFPEIQELTTTDWLNLQSHPPKTWKDVLDVLAPTLAKVENHQSSWPDRNSTLSKISELNYLIEIQGAKQGKNLSYIFYQKVLMAFRSVRVVKKHIEIDYKPRILKPKFPKITNLNFTSELFSVIRETSNLLFQQNEVKVSHFKFFHSIVTTVSNILCDMAMPDLYPQGTTPAEEESEKEAHAIIEAFMASKSIGKPQDTLIYGLLDLAFALEYKQNAKLLAGSPHNFPVLFRPLFEDYTDPYILFLQDVLNIILCFRNTYAFVASNLSYDKLNPCSFVYPEEAKAVVQLLGSALANCDFGKFNLSSGALDFMTDAVTDFMNCYDYYSVLYLDKAADNFDRLLASLLDEKFLAALETHPKHHSVVLAMMEQFNMLAKPLYGYPGKLTRAKNNNQTKLMGPLLGEKYFSFDYEKLIDNKLAERFPKSFVQVARIPFVYGLRAFAEWMNEALDDYSAQKAQSFFEAFEKFYRQYKVPGKFMEFTAFIRGVTDNNANEKTYLKYFDEGKLFEKLPELFFDTIEPAFKVLDSNLYVFQYLYNMMSRQPNSEDKIPMVQQIFEKFVSYATQNISLELKSFEPIIANATSLPEEEILKAIDRQHSLIYQWKCFLSSTTDAIRNGGLQVKDNYIKFIDLLKYPSVLFLDQFGNHLSEMVCQTYRSGTQENKVELTHLIFDNLLEIYGNLWGESSTQELINENEIIQIPLLHNSEWLFTIVEGFEKDGNEADVDWNLGIKMDVKSRQFAHYLFYATKVLGELNKQQTCITPILPGYRNLSKLENVLKSSTLILKLTIQKYLEAKLSQKDAFSSEKAEWTYEDLVHPMIGRNTNTSLFKKMTLALLQMACNLNKDAPEKIILFFFSQFETCENRDLQKDPKEASKQLWNVLLFDVLQNVKEINLIAGKLAAGNKALLIHQIIFDPSIFPKIVNWILNFTPLDCLDPLFKECGKEIGAQFDSIVNFMKNDAQWIKGGIKFTQNKYEPNQRRFSQCIANLSEIFDTRKDLLPIMRSDSMPMLRNLIELFLARIEQVLEAQECNILYFIFFA